MRKIYRKRRKKHRKILVFVCVCFLFIMTVGYAAFSTSLNITAKGNIKNLKEEVDSKVPTDELLFWGQYDNEENTLTVLKDKSANNNDGIMYGFDNMATSGYTDEGLVFDGVNDYVDIGLANYDFQNSISYVVYVKLNNIVRHQIIIGGWNNDETSCYDGGGSGIFFQVDKNLGLSFDLFNGVIWGTVNTLFVPKIDSYYSLVATYDGNIVKFYIDSILEESREKDNTLAPFGNSIKIGAYVCKGLNSFANMTLKEAMVYDRALTENEVKTITEGFEKKYK